MKVRKCIVKLAANYLSQFFQKKSTSKTNLKKNIAKQKYLWKTFKSPDLYKSFSVLQTNAIDDNEHL